MIRLSDGNDMPCIGLASYRKNNVEETEKQIENSLQVGMKYFEITELFGNEHMIMNALSTTPRSEIFVSLRLWPKDRKYKEILRSVKEVLKGANLDYVDLLVLHAPIDPVNKFDQWKAMEELKDMGMVKSLGAGSLTLLQLMDLLKNCNFAPSVLEIEVTPFYQLNDLLEYCQDSSIAIISNEPCAKGLRRNNEVVRAVSDYLGVSPDEVMIRWGVTRGYAVLIPPIFVTTDLLGVKDVNSLSEPLPEDVMKSLNQCNVLLKTSWDTNDEEVEQ